MWTQTSLYISGTDIEVARPRQCSNGQVSPWWRHQMETFSALLAVCAGNSPSPVNSPHKGQWRGALMFSLICAWINGWVNNREAGDLRRHRADYDVIVMWVPEFHCGCSLHGLHFCVCNMRYGCVVVIVYDDKRCLLWENYGESVR